MSYSAMVDQATYTRQAIVQLLKASIGSVRTFASGNLTDGVFDGQLASAQKALTLPALSTGTIRFDVEIGALTSHPATPASIKGSYRLGLLQIGINVYEAMIATEAENDLRNIWRQGMSGALWQIIQVVGYPGNLTQTSAGGATGIVSGCLVGPDGTGQPEASVPEEDWDEKMIRGRVDAAAVVTIAQAVA